MTTESESTRRALSEAAVTSQCLNALRMFGLEPVRQNVGGRHEGDRYVSFGTPGDSDWRARLRDGRTLYLEIKREGFDPEKVRGRARDRWGRQLAALRKANMTGDVGLWTDDALQLIEHLRAIVTGGSVELDARGRVTVRGGN